MSWKPLYQSRITTAENAVKSIQSNQRLFLSGNASMPKNLVAALVQRAPELKNVEICQALTIGSADYVAPAMSDHLRVNTLFISHNVRQAVQEGRADFTPVLLSELPLLFRDGHLSLDVALVHLSLPDEHGYCSFGVEVGLTKSPAESAKIIIAEINPRMPRTLGDAFIHVSKLTHIVPVDYPLPEMAMVGDCSAENIRKIALSIAELIPDGATLQMGIGAIPDAVLKFLGDKKDLGIHSELFSDGVMDLVETGVMTGARKTLHPGKIVAGFVLGSQKLYEWIHDNPMIELHPTEYINDPFVIAQHERMVAINSAIEVDLTGQVCADSIGTRLYSGIGGQLDFIYGASRSKGGVPIIALPSTTTLPNGRLVSKISTVLQSGAGVTTTRNHVHYVVTEYGATNLYGKSIRQRAEALISIAHPQFRDELGRQARELHYFR